MKEKLWGQVTAKARTRTLFQMKHGMDLPPLMERELCVRKSKGEEKGSGPVGAAKERRKSSG